MRKFLYFLALASILLNFYLVERLELVANSLDAALTHMGTLAEDKYECLQSLSNDEAVLQDCTPIDSIGHVH